VVRALKAWRELRERERGAPLTGSDPVFVEAHGAPINVDRLAERFRDHLKAAGIERPTLFDNNAARRRIRAHDLRATFITIALAIGRSERWVADRTGHRSSAMIARYYRAARTAAELGLGDLSPLDEALPDLERAGKPPAKGGMAGGNNQGVGGNPNRSGPVHEEGLEPSSLAAPEPKADELVAEQAARVSRVARNYNAFA
jgi:hypothetical protein